MNVTAESIRAGISACLLGDKVRYDGGHKHDRFLTDTLGRFVEWVPVCPEVEIGLGTPREPIHLIRRHGDIHLVGVRTGADHTDAMQAYARKRVNQLAGERLSGFILKQDSPSCGLERVQVHRDRAGKLHDWVAVCLRQRWPSDFRTCRLRRRSDSTIHNCGRTGLSVYVRTVDFSLYGRHVGALAIWFVFTRLIGVHSLRTTPKAISAWVGSSPV